MSDHAAGARMRSASAILRDILGDLERAAANAPETAAPGVIEANLGDILDRLDERAFGVMLLLLALPCTLPFVYLLPQIVALPMLALAGQMALGRRSPWLPERLRRRRFSVPDFRTVIDRSEKYLGWVEKLARPRLRPVTGHGAARLVGLILLVPIASILVPLPATNTVPGIGVAIAALGLIQRDGALVILGMLIGFVWVALLFALGLEAASLIKGWLAGLL